MLGGWRAGAGVAAAALALAACGGARSAAHPQRSAGQAASPSPAGTTSPGSVGATASSAAPTGTPSTPSAAVALTGEDLSFTSAATGWLLGLPQPCGAPTNTAPSCPAILEHTSDGALSWQRRPVPAVAAQGELSHVRFADAADGWLYDPRLWATHDGGRTWRAVGLPAPVVALSARGGTSGTVLAVLQAASGFQLWSSPTGRDGWHQVGAAATLPAPGSVQLVRSGPAQVYLLDVNPAGAAGARATLVASADGGAHLEQQVDPCAANSFSQSLAVDSAGGLWLACGPEPASGALQPGKELYRSTTGGRSWTGPLPLPGEGSLGSVTAATPTTALLTLDRAPLLQSRDGGQTWQAVAPDRGDSGFFAGGWVDPEHAYVLTSGELWWTADGGAHWRSRPLAG